MKTYLKLDPLTMPEDLRYRITKDSDCLKPIEHNVSTFEFTLADFVHAQELLTLHPETYGSDLALYLPTIIDYLKRHNESFEITLSFGGTDFRRKMSEDFGVGLAALFMNKALRVQWNTIIQVPTNKKLQAKKPDFQGFDDGGSNYFFEAKGTTSAANLEKQISKGREQVKSYRKAAKAKFVIASYISGDSTHFPTTTFVVDPPYDGEGVNSLDEAAQLHQASVLGFLGLRDQATAYRVLLGEDWKIAGESYVGYSTAKERNYNQAKDSFNKSWESFDWEIQKFGNQLLYIQEQTYDTEEGSISVKKGIIKARLDQIREFRTVSKSEEPLGLEDSPHISFFDDGTLLAFGVRS